MAVKKHKIVAGDACWRVYWDGRAIQGEMLDDKFEWKIVASLYKKKSGWGFELKTFSYNRSYGGGISVSYYTSEYASADAGIKNMEHKMNKLTIPQEVREFLDAHDTMKTLAYTGN